MEQDGLPHVDSKEAHMPYSFEFAAAIYALASTVLAMYVTVIELVTKRMNSVNQEGSKLENFAWGYVMIYPLVIMLIITAVCLETMSREYIFYAYLRNGILLDLADANTNVLSIEYWDPRTSSAGLFPHACIISTIILGLVTRGWSSSLIIVCGQTFTLLIFFNSVLSLKSRLVSLAEFAQKTIQTRTADTQAAVNNTNKERHKLSTTGIDLDGDGVVDVRCCFVTGDEALGTNRSPALIALDEQYAVAFAAQRAATAAAMEEVAALLARLECITEADVCADFGSLVKERQHLSDALNKKKISKEEYATRIATLRFAFGERDPATGERLPTPGFMGRQPLASSATNWLANILVYVVYVGILNKLWALKMVPSRQQSYAGAAARTHARFGKRNTVLLLAAAFCIVCIEIYGLTKGTMAMNGDATCEEQMVAMCKSQVCMDAVCPSISASLGRR